LQQIERKLYAYNLWNTFTVTENSQILLTDYFIHKYNNRARVGSSIFIITLSGASILGRGENDVLTVSEMCTG